jgi:SAM-dependent MidA family methyltransferase
MTETQLAGKIKALIRANGPISVTDFFSLCLADPEHGYYQTREPFGRAGDFVTAPEISQLFGEMIGIFLVHAWQRHGEPANPRLIEVGPGRGTMMADILRVIAKLSPALYQSVGVHLVETSVRLQAVQKETLAIHAGHVHWHQSFDSVPAGFTLLAANELFDAIPIRQFVKTPTGFRERMITLDRNDELAFGVGPAGIDPGFLPGDPSLVPEGTVFEIAPARQAVMETLCERLKNSGGTAIIIDYGTMVTGFGDTLQAVLKHEYDPPLAHPGEADLTSHVDFQHLAEVAKASGLSINGCLRQGDFLYGLGLQQRVNALSAGKDPAMCSLIQAAASRLADEGEGKMGELFKVLAVSSPAVDLLPFRPQVH